MDGIGLIIGTAIPPLGIAYGCGRAFIAHGNFRLAKRGNRIAELSLLGEPPQVKDI